MSDYVSSLLGYTTPQVGPASFRVDPLANFKFSMPDTINEVPAYTGGELGLWDGFKNLFGGFLQQKNADGSTTGGWGSAALGVAQGLGNAYMGMQQYGLAKKALAQSKEQFERNYAAQRQTTNASLEDRQRARVASNPTAYQSVGDYMNTYGIR